MTAYEPCIQFHAFWCVHSKSQILRVRNVKKQNLTQPKAAKLATLHILLSTFCYISHLFSYLDVSVTDH